ncbi:MAG: hypothetical protein ABEH43_09590, partial [Flavobacteriales bacterium]
GYGAAVSTAYDINGDTYDDVVVGAGGANSIYVYFGSCIITATSMVQTSCSGSSDGKAIVNTAASGSFSYEWKDSTGNIIASNDTANNVSQGQYFVKVVDNAMGCSDSDSVWVDGPTPLSTQTDSNQVTCPGDSDGVAIVSVNGGTTPYSYTWDDPSNSSNDTATNLTAGMYHVTVNDSNNCSIQDSAEVTGPPPITSTTSANQVSCNNDTDGSVITGATGGTSPYTYLWDTPNNDTTSSVTNLAPGTYHVTITDNKGCTKKDSATVSNPPPLSLSMDSIPPICKNDSNGAAVVNASGGTPYAGAEYNYNWENGDTTDTAQGLPDGNYWVVVTDKMGCNTTDSVTVTEPPLLTVEAGNNANICIGDTMSLGGNPVASGGGGGF